MRKPTILLLKALSTEDPTCIERYSTSKGELGQLSKLIMEVLQDKAKLTIEISDRKNVENALRESEERYRNLVETSPDAIILLDFAGVILLNNQISLSLLGIEPGNLLINERIYSFIPEKDHERLMEMFEHIKKNERIKAFECIMRKNKSSDAFNAEISISAVKNSTGGPNALICIIRDISERKRMELEKSKLEEQFRSVYKMEAIGQLAGGVAHDFNNILGAISGYSDIIKLRYPDDQKLQKYATMILSASTRASELTKKLLTFSRKSKIQMDSFDAHVILFEVKEILSHTIDKSIVVTTDFSSDQAIIYGDAAQFESAIMNLALNARDAMPEGGSLTISTKIVFLNQKLTIFHAYTITPGNYLSISIKDSGMGMDQKILSHLFEPFFTTKDVGKGTGLGLASAYGTVKSHNGYIDVQSEPGKGSTFTMYLPAPATHKIKASHTVKNIRKGKGNILIVDDESIIRDAVREMLSWLGYSVNSCSDGKEAIEYYAINHETTDLVILDMIMPGINGRECFKQLKQISSTVKVLLATGYRIDEERTSLLEDGILGILQKPFVSAQLAQAVHDVISGR